jgi:integrase
MSDIRKRTGTKGTTYQVRYADPSAKTGYSYKTFETAKEARAFREDAGARQTARPAESLTVAAAVQAWLDICEKEGLNGREPITPYTLENYEYRASFITAYAWAKSLAELTTPDIVEFRSHLLRSGASRALAGKVLSSFQSMMKEMTRRGRIQSNCALGVNVREDSRYDEPVVIPSMADIKALLRAADTLADAKNLTVQNAWKRYRPMLYLAVDSGMRPQEYLAAAQSALGERGIRVDRAIDGDGKTLTVTKTQAGRRFIDLSENTLDMVRYYAEKEAVSNTHDLIFPDRNGGWQSRRNWQRRGFNVACEKAGLMTKEEGDNGDIVLVPKYRPYDLRHFFASYHIAQKTNLKKLQALMGHRNIETTLNVYGHLLSDDEASARGLLNSLV